MQSSVALGVSECPNIGDPLSGGSQGRAAGLGLDMTPERLEGEGERMEVGQAGPLEVYHPGESVDERDSSIVVSEALRCQVKITTRRSLHLRIANHTARDVYVRLVGHGGRIAGISTGLPRNTLEQSKIGKQRQKYVSEVHQDTFKIIIERLFSRGLVKFTGIQ